MKKRRLHGSKSAHFEPIYYAVSCQLRGFKTASYILRSLPEQQTMNRLLIKILSLSVLIILGPLMRL
jgi:hypothetical protein